MNEHARVRSLRSAMTKTPRIPPRPRGAPPAPADEQAASNPFASFGAAAGDGDGETKLYQVPRELIELARARAENASSAGTLTPIAPRPNAELEATLSAYTAGLRNTSERAPSFAPEGEAALSGSRAQSLEQKPLLRSPVAPRGPVAPRHSLPVAARHTEATRTSSEPVSSPPASARPWLFYLGLCLLLSYCAHLLLNS